MKESKNNTILNKYLRQARLFCYYELKVAKGGRFQFSEIEENQDEGLPALAENGLVWKLSDEDVRKKPCDGFCAPPLPAYLVIRFYNKFYFIPYERIMTMRQLGKKGISETECMPISTKILNV